MNTNTYKTSLFNSAHTFQNFFTENKLIFGGDIPEYKNYNVNEGYNHNTDYQQQTQEIIENNKLTQEQLDLKAKELYKNSDNGIIPYHLRIEQVADNEKVYTYSTQTIRNLAQKPAGYTEVIKAKYDIAKKQEIQSKEARKTAKNLNTKVFTESKNAKTALKTKLDGYNKKEEVNLSEDFLDMIKDGDNESFNFLLTSLSEKNQALSNEIRNISPDAILGILTANFGQSPTLLESIKKLFGKKLDEKTSLTKSDIGFKTTDKHGTKKYTEAKVLSYINEIQKEAMPVLAQAKKLGDAYGTDIFPTDTHGGFIAEAGFWNGRFSIPNLRADKGSTELYMSVANTGNKLNLTKENLEDLQSQNFFDIGNGKRAKIINNYLYIIDKTEIKTDLFGNDTLQESIPTSTSINQIPKLMEFYKGDISQFASVDANGDVTYKNEEIARKMRNIQIYLSGNQNYPVYLTEQEKLKDPNRTPDVDDRTQSEEENAILFGQLSTKDAIYLSQKELDQKLATKRSTLLTETGKFFQKNFNIQDFKTAQFASGDTFGRFETKESDIHEGGMFEAPRPKDIYEKANSGVEVSRNNVLDAVYLNNILESAQDSGLNIEKIEQFALNNGKALYKLKDKNKNLEPAIKSLFSEYEKSISRNDPKIKTNNILSRIYYTVLFLPAQRKGIAPATALRMVLGKDKIENKKLTEAEKSGIKVNAESMVELVQRFAPESLKKGNWNFSVGLNLTHEKNGTAPKGWTSEAYNHVKSSPIKQSSTIWTPTGRVEVNADNCTRLVNEETRETTYIVQHGHSVDVYTYEKEEHNNDPQLVFSASLTMAEEQSGAWNGSLSGYGEARIGGEGAGVSLSISADNKVKLMDNVALIGRATMPININTKGKLPFSQMGELSGEEKSMHTTEKLPFIAYPSLSYGAEFFDHLRVEADTFGTQTITAFNIPISKNYLGSIGYFQNNIQGSAGFSATITATQHKWNEKIKEGISHIAKQDVKDLLVEMKKNLPKGAKELMTGANDLMQILMASDEIMDKFMLSLDSAGFTFMDFKNGHVDKIFTLMATFVTSAEVVQIIKNNTANTAEKFDIAQKHLLSEVVIKPASHEANTLKSGKFLDIKNLKNSSGGPALLGYDEDNNFEINQLQVINDYKHLVEVSGTKFKYLSYTDQNTGKTINPKDNWDLYPVPTIFSKYVAGATQRTLIFSRNPAKSIAKSETKDLSHFDAGSIKASHLRTVNNAKNIEFSDARTSLLNKLPTLIETQTKEDVITTITPTVREIITERNIQLAGKSFELNDFSIQMMQDYENNVKLSDGKTVKESVNSLWSAIKNEQFLRTDTEKMQKVINQNQALVEKYFTQENTINDVFEAIVDSIMLRSKVYLNDKKGLEKRYTGGKKHFDNMLKNSSDFIIDKSKYSLHKPAIDVTNGVPESMDFINPLVVMDTIQNSVAKVQYNSKKVYFPKLIESTDEYDVYVGYFDVCKNASIIKVPKQKVIIQKTAEYYYEFSQKEKTKKNPRYFVKGQKTEKEKRMGIAMLTDDVMLRVDYETNGLQIGLKQTLPVWTEHKETIFVRDENEVKKENEKRWVDGGEAQTITTTRTETYTIPGPDVTKTTTKNETYTIPGPDVTKTTTKNETHTVLNGENTCNIVDSQKEVIGVVKNNNSLANQPIRELLTHSPITSTKNLNTKNINTNANLIKLRETQKMNIDRMQRNAREYEKEKSLREAEDNGLF